MSFENIVQGFIFYYYIYIELLLWKEKGFFLHIAPLSYLTLISPFVFIHAMEGNMDDVWSILTYSFGLFLDIVHSLFSNSISAGLYVAKDGIIDMQRSQMEALWHLTSCKTNAGVLWVQANGFSHLRLMLIIYTLWGLMFQGHNGIISVIHLHYTEGNTIYLTIFTMLDIFIADPHKLNV